MRIYYVGLTPAERKRIKDDIVKAFDGNIRDEDPTSFGSLSFSEDDKYRYVSLGRFIRDGVQRLGLSDTKQYDTPASTDLVELVEGDTSEELKPAEASVCRARIGFVTYVARELRVDVRFHVSVISARFSKPTRLTLFLITRVIGYLLRYPDIGPRYSKGYDVPPCSYADASHWITRDSLNWSGWVISWAGAFILAGSKKQSSVARSASDSEILASSLAFFETECFRVSLYYLFPDAVPSPQLCYADNSGHIFAVRTDTTKNTRHMAVHLNYCRDRVRKNSIALVQVSTADMLADFFTKALPGPLHWRFLQAIFNLNDEPFVPTVIPPREK